MKIDKNYIYKIICSLVIAFNNGCATSLQEKPVNHPVSWSSAFQMPDLLKTPLLPDKQSDLQALLQADWYANVTVLEPTNSKEVVLSNCEQYFSEKNKPVRPLNGHEINAFLELSTMCTATKLLLNAKNARKSNIPKKIFDKSIPKKLPHIIALQTSVSETEKHIHDQSKQYWADINKNFQFKAISANQMSLQHDSGQQDLALIGKGDFNHDGLEDILISTRDSVDGGTYFNLRLFIFSVNTSGQWLLVSDYK